MAFNIKPEALISLFELYKGKTFCHLDTCTVPKLNKKGRVSGLTIHEIFLVSPDTIRKYSEFSAGIGYEYAYVVMNRLIKDGKSPFDYQPGDTWHEPYNGSTVIRRHKTNGDLYVFVTLIANNPAKVEYRSGELVLPTEELKEFLPTEHKATNQGLDKDRVVDVRTLKLVSITRLVAEKAEYIVG
jgi:hypothetical protein